MKPDMKPETVARIRFTPPKAAWRPPTGPRYSTLCRFEGEAREAPYGKWTLLIEFWQVPQAGQDGYASIKLLSESAPSLCKGVRFTLFEGPYVIGYGEVVRARASTVGRRDRPEVLGSLDTAPIVGGP